MTKNDDHVANRIETKFDVPEENVDKNLEFYRNFHKIGMYAGETRVIEGTAADGLGKKKIFAETLS